ncbi:unnamed protein product, partial [Cylicostephanus goldi]
MRPYHVVIHITMHCGYDQRRVVVMRIHYGTIVNEKCQWATDISPIVGVML